MAFVMNRDVRQAYEELTALFKRMEPDAEENGVWIVAEDEQERSFGVDGAALRFAVAAMMLAHNESGGAVVPGWSELEATVKGAFIFGMFAERAAAANPITSEIPF